MTAILQQQQQGSNGANKQCLTVNLVLQRCRMNDPFHVRRMNVCGSALEDISVMDQFTNVEVCSFAVNDISDLEALRNCHRLQELYLRKNRIADFGQLLHLSHLPLRALGLAENPISSHPDYRKFVISAMPSLTKLDDQEITPAERSDAEHEIADPFAVAMEMGVASAPAIAGRPSSTALQGNMDLNASVSTPPRKQQQQQESPYDAFAASTNGNSSVKKQQQQDPLSMTSPSGMKRIITQQQQTEEQRGNRYNGDDVPIGGGGGGFVAAPRPRNANSTPPVAQQQQQQPQTQTQTGNNNTQSFLTKKREQLRQHQQQQQMQEQQQVQSHSKPTSMQQQSSFNNTNTINAQSSSSASSFSEDAAVKAVKILLDGMSAQGLAQIKRYINTL